MATPTPPTPAPPPPPPPAAADAHYDTSRSASLHTDPEQTKPEQGPSAPRRPSINNVASIPDGGWTAWSQVLGGFFILFNSWGIVNTFGAFQTYYETGALFSASSSAIAWIGALQASLLLLVGVVTGPVYDAGHFRALLAAGSVLIVLGHMLLAQARSYAAALLAQALCVGVGCGLVYVPGVAIIATYFTTRVALAMGITAAGSSLGGLVYPILFHRLQAQLGFAWTTRILGFVALATLALPNALMQMRVRPAARRALVEWRALREAPYALYVAGGLLGFTGLYMPFVYIQYYAIVARAVDASLGFYLLAILNAASVFGRIVPNYFADRVGPFNTMIPSTVATGAVALALLAPPSKAGVVTITLLYGFASGTFVSLPPAVVVSLTCDRGMIGTRLGMAFAINAVGLLIGTPIGGAILGGSSDAGAQPELADLNFAGVWVFGGVLVLAAAVFFVAARVAKVGVRLSAVA